MTRRPPRSTRTDTLFPTRRSSNLAIVIEGAHVVHEGGKAVAIAAVGQPSTPTKMRRVEERRREASPGRSRNKLLTALEKSAGRRERDRKSTRLNTSH